MAFEAPFNLFGQIFNGGLAPMHSAGLPRIKTNMAPPANFWEGNKFHIGAPGMQETPVGDPAHPATPPPPPPPPSPPVPPTVGVGGGAFMPGGMPPNPFIPRVTNEQGTLGYGQASGAAASLPATIRNAVPYIDPSTVELAPSAANPYYRPGAKWQQDGYGKNPFLPRGPR